jgi:hypothetical protein
MSIDPTKSGTGQPLGGPRIDQAGGNQSARHFGAVRAGSPDAPRDAERGHDQVRLSEAVRAAARSEAEASPAGISQERLREILKRLTSGYYNNPQVLERIARRIHEEWGRGDVHID